MYKPIKNATNERRCNAFVIIMPIKRLRNEMPPLLSPYSSSAIDALMIILLAMNTFKLKTTIANVKRQQFKMTLASFELSFRLFLGENSFLF
jgi:hypothetical protein